MQQQAPVVPIDPHADADQLDVGAAFEQRSDFGRLSLSERQDLPSHRDRDLVVLRHAACSPAMSRSHIVDTSGTPVIHSIHNHWPFGLISRKK